jgi:hypothetical protein
MKADSKLSWLILVSPWLLLVFLIIPILVILSITLHVGLPLAGPKPLLINNICFALLVACRLLRYLSCMNKAIRYGVTNLRPRQSAALPIPVTEVRSVLSRAGFTFSDDGGYGEKRDLGYLGTTVIYAGLLILLAVGSWDNLRMFSGVLLDGMGPATSLNKVESYRSINKGPFAASLAALPRMQIISQTLPDSTYPKGATELVLTAADGKAQELTLIPGKPVDYGAFDISMAKLVFQPQIVIKTRDSKTLHDSFVQLDPLVQKRGVYSFYGLFQGPILGGGVYYQPEKSMLMVVITRGNEKVVTDLAFQVDQQVVKGDYILSCAKMGQWSEIHVIHRRHKGLLVIGGIFAIIGLLLRIAIRPQRIWLEETGEGSLVRAAGNEAMDRLKVEG